MAGYNPGDVRAMVTGCAADPHIFDATMRDNLQLAKPTAGDAELAAAAGRARLATLRRPVQAERRVRRGSPGG